MFYFDGLGTFNPDVITQTPGGSPIQTSYGRQKLGMKVTIVQALDTDIA